MFSLQKVAFADCPLPFGKGERGLGFLIQAPHLLSSKFANLPISLYFCTKLYLLNRNKANEYITIYHRR